MYKSIILFIFALIYYANCQCSNPAATFGNTICGGSAAETADCAAEGGVCEGFACCINPISAVTTVTSVTITPSTSTGDIGPCFDNECPTGYTCITETQRCLISGCIGACFDNECPTGYTCNTSTQLCCSTTSSVTTSPTTTCRDLIGPRGYSDCPARASLCNNTVYYNLMTQQCPRTCNRCTSTLTATSSSTTCVDLARANGTSDCPQLAYLCNNTAYTTLMTQQCPRTCGRCSTTG